MQHKADPESLASAERLLNAPLPWLSELPEVSELTTSFQTLESDSTYSIRRLPPPPLWTKVGNAHVQEYYRTHPEHPMANDDRAQRRRRAAFLILNFAHQAPSTFTTQHMKSLHVCLFDCDASIRHDMVKTIGFIKNPTSAAPLEELITREPESETVIALATVIHKTLQNVDL